jgi:hypothetical protein
MGGHTRCTLHALESIPSLLNWTPIHRSRCSQKRKLEMSRCRSQGKNNIKIGTTTN